MRYARLGLHLLWGALTVAAVYRFLNDDARLWLKQRWSQQLLDILAIHLDANLHGVPHGSLIVANHISWLDIFVLNAIRPMAFVSKSEVRDWPLAGWLAANTDTLFLRRGCRADAIDINARIETLLAAGKDVAVFPEGTTTDGSHLQPFHGALLQPAIDSKRPVQPLALAYFDRSGRRSIAPAYAGETTMAECMAEIIASRSLYVRLRPTPPIVAGTLTRREVAVMARSAVAYHLSLLAETEDSSAEDIYSFCSRSLSPSVKSSTLF
ncbi:lysophospholipid acyltransferase family protein [Propionivibrio dicarboxylicus]|uniref:1-acyl-sn-glycerol-3-phosphate acyltransferase n=1 Tax=Propionivibrio dicarboxylicus TaxID=83767 RepID=A0A1G8ET53_9RHOO|nr:lysophospholipid acyltransferase family protein [Propionivibrio dicarboxylicus]SDH73007.1 1-acyl-sn-glycerol-3-phosphate acyltransferase [Propionivibrio dicarboxylicus]